MSVQQLNEPQVSHEVYVRVLEALVILLATSNLRRPCCQNTPHCCQNPATPHDSLRLCADTRFMCVGSLDILFRAPRGWAPLHRAAPHASRLRRPCRAIPLSLEQQLAVAAYVEGASVRCTFGSHRLDLTCMHIHIYRLTHANSKYTHTCMHAFIQCYIAFWFDGSSRPEHAQGAHRGTGKVATS